MSTPATEHRGTIISPQPFSTVAPTRDVCDADLIEFIEAQRSRNPTAVAVCCNGQRLTYGELDRQANQLAWHLISCGVGTNAIVGVYLKRTVEMVIACLATLKAGAAYLPLDPGYPEERIASFIADAGCPLVITNRNRVDQFAGTTVVLERHKDVIAAQCQDRPAVTLTPEQLAYVIFTSGSTGRPKGVAVTRESLTNLVQWHQEAFRVTPADRASQIASLGFDASVWELWPYLASGASVYLVDEDARIDQEALRDWLVANGITISFAPTPMAERLIALAWPPETRLRTLLTGGDVLTTYPAESLPFTLVNNYGPTECTVVATSGVVLPRTSAHLPPVGKPITNTWVHILDEQQRPVPDGAVGELYIGGAGVARGYINQPERTAERFIPDPTRNSGRVYRTGDLGYRLPDGQIAVVGRTDDQIKIRGYRIEPGEITFVLNSHAGVLASGVIAQGTAEDRQLIAYIVPSNATPLRRTALQEYLRGRLPSYMIPAVFVMVDALPLTTNGKLDRSLLPKPSTDNVLGDATAESPRTIIEERVASVVSELLDVKRVALHDNFFMLGGHSLLGTQLIARLRTEFSVEVPLRTLFEKPSVAELSEELETLILARLNANQEHPDHP